MHDSITPPGWCPPPCPAVSLPLQTSVQRGYCCRAAAKRLLFSWIPGAAPAPSHMWRLCGRVRAAQDGSGVLRAPRWFERFLAVLAVRCCGAGVAVAARSAGCCSCWVQDMWRIRMKHTASNENNKGADGFFMAEFPVHHPVSPCLNLTVLPYFIPLKKLPRHLSCDFCTWTQQKKLEANSSCTASAFGCAGGFLPPA